MLINLGQCMSALIWSDACCFLEPAGYILELHWSERLLYAVVLHTCETLGVEFRYLWQCFCMTKQIYLRQIYVKRFFCNESLKFECKQLSGSCTFQFITWNEKKRGTVVECSKTLLSSILSFRFFGYLVLLKRTNSWYFEIEIAAKLTKIRTQAGWMWVCGVCHFARISTGYFKLINTVKVWHFVLPIPL